MPSLPRTPLDPFPYRRDSRSRVVGRDLPDGDYVYVRDVDGQVFVLPDGPHRHPCVLGGGRPAMYAGDMRIEAAEIVELTNLSGTFQFDEIDGLREVVAALEAAGMVVRPGCVRLFPNDGGRPFVVE